MVDPHYDASHDGGTALSTVRVASPARFVRVDSRSINDATLSYRARGVLAWLLDKPDTWTVRAESIAAHGTEGRDAIRAALAELAAAGYLRRHRFREAGRWASEQTLLEHPSVTMAGFQRRFTSAGFPGPLASTQATTSSQEIEVVQIPPPRALSSSAEEGDDDIGEAVAEVVRETTIRVGSDVRALGPAVAAALRAGWGAPDLTDRLSHRTATARNPLAVLQKRLATLGPPPAQAKLLSARRYGARMVVQFGGIPEALDYLDDGDPFQREVAELLRSEAAWPT